MMSSSSLTRSSWTCSRCTYEHQYPCARCVMCSELRVTKKDMQDFLEGKTMQTLQQQQRKQNKNKSQPGDDTNDVSDSNGKEIENENENASVARGKENPRQPSLANQAIHLKTTKLPKPSKPPPKQSHQLPKGHRMLSYSPGPVPLDPSTASTWIYPCSPDYPKRNYQWEITHTALSHNTLVSLPTGLGKTFIAATVVYNYYRWFPTGRILFLAPTLPLVQQQVQACYRITGIPVHDTGLLTGKLAPAQRAQVWNNCRVLFGTPQTIQHDVAIDDSRARTVVCIVFDEAHKAVGEYAYVKVMEQLAVGAGHFCRVLGLSATPGTSIQAIQKVVTALRMNRLETRTEQDVSDYTHDRASEVVLVPTATIQRRVQQLLDDKLLDPLLRKLKDAGGLTNTRGTTATLTPYCLLQATQAYAAAHTNGGPLMGTLIASQKLVQIRCDIHRQGLGVVRNKLQQCLKQPARGVWSTIVKSDAFLELCETVRDATNSADATTGTTHDRVRNNPKLQKLIEVLLEHFARHTTDTRVIVFSQFRESVGNIKAALEAHRPQIRPRHFVGQSNGAAAKQQHDSVLKGMKQAEQQRVITEFRNGEHNVLVCTCIGEEGLDIGQVDLIVNFDCLSSPIRMMQRVGRTGRKRNGRVVTLVSEGAEQATHRTSLQKERNLLHALRNPRSFTVAATVPLLPQPPVCVEQAIVTADPVFHFSQMEGVKKKPRLAQQQTKIGNRTKTDNATTLMGWESPDSTSPSTRTLMLQCFLPARACANRRSSSQTPRRGPTSLWLRQLEQTYGIPPRVRKRNTIPQFPMERQADDMMPRHVIKRSVPVPLRNVHQSVVAKPVEQGNKTRNPTNELVAPLQKIARSNRPQPTKLPPETTISVNPYAQRRPAACPLVNAVNVSSAVTAPLSTSRTHYQPRPIVAANNPYSTAADRTVSRPSHSTGIAGGTRAGRSVNPYIKATQVICAVPVPPTHATNPYVTARNNAYSKPTIAIAEQQPQGEKSSSSDTKKAARVQPSATNNESQEFCQFKLPTQEDDDSTVDSSNQSAKPTDDPIRPTTANIAVQQKATEEEITFCLPTPSSSSEDEDDDNLHTAQNQNSTATAAHDQLLIPTSFVSHPIKQAQLSPIDSPPSRSVDAIHNPYLLSSVTQKNYTRSPGGHQQANEKRVDMLLCDSGIAASAPSAIRFSQPGSEDILIVKRKRKRGLVIEDTPESTAKSQMDRANPLLDSPTSCDAPSSCRMKVKKKKALVIEDTPPSGLKRRNLSESKAVVQSTATSLLGLTNTPSQTHPVLDPDTVICAICTSKATTDDDPIILCDRCDMAVHVTCYAASVDLVNDDEREWFCDMCKADTTSDMVCSKCGITDGILKQADLVGYWHHVRCPKQAARRDASSKRRTPLIDLSQNDEEKLDNWKKQRRQACQQFIETEALAGSDDDECDEDEDEIAAMEEEEANTSFINDSSQVGYSQQTEDELDVADRALMGKSFAHRALDAARDKLRQFDTPNFNRQQNRSSLSGGSPNSCSGLGNLHFVRSVIEHHKQGGDAEDIEKLYHELAKDTQDDE